LSGQALTDANMSVAQQMRQRLMSGAKHLADEPDPDSQAPPGMFHYLMVYL